MKFDIIDEINNERVAVVETNNGKNALRLFLQRNIMSTGMYEFHKIDGVWHMNSTYGSEFTARKWGVIR